MFDDLGRSLRLARSGAVCRPLRRRGRRFPLGQPRRPAIPACRRDPPLVVPALWGAGRLDRLAFRSAPCRPPRLSRGRCGVL